jgi:hypothetical protein
MKCQEEIEVKIGKYGATYEHKLQAMANHKLKNLRQDIDAKLTDNVAKL